MKAHELGFNGHGWTKNQGLEKVAPRRKFILCKLPEALNAYRRIKQVRK